jgi:hemerythrin-like metal-binding protein
MSGFIWNQSYSVGVLQFDIEHQRLILLLNDLYNAKKQGKAQERVPVIINELVDYTFNHFVNEEKLFTKFQYPLAKPHIEKHNEFRKKLQEVKQQMASGYTGLGDNVIDLMIDWIKNHIQKTDKLYTDFMHEKGIK